MEIDKRRMRCTIYARTAVKPARNAPLENANNSIESQVALCTHYVDALSGACVARYADVGASGNILEERPGWDTMVADAAGGHFDVVVVTEPARVARSRDAYKQAQSLLGDAGVRLLFAVLPVYGGEDGGRFSLETAERWQAGTFLEDEALRTLSKAIGLTRNVSPGR